VKRVNGVYGTSAWYKKIRPFVLARDGYRCQIRLPGVCANLDGKRLPANRLEVDHIHPRRRGGSDHPHNLRAACIPCNRHLGADAMNRERFNSRKW